MTYLPDLTMPDDLARRAALHSRMAGRTLCLACNQRWPCDASRFATALTAEQAQLAAAQARIAALERVADAARTCLAACETGPLHHCCLPNTLVAAFAALDADA